MIRYLTRWCFLGVIVCVASVPEAFAQLTPKSVASTAPAAESELHGVVRDDGGRALAGAVVSALGSMTAFAVSDRDGRFAFRNLPAGPYLVRVHLQGYLPQRGRIIQATVGTHTLSTVALTRLDPDKTSGPTVLAAGIGPVDVPAADDETPSGDDHGEVAWRMRHAKRSVLKETEYAIAEPETSFLGDSLGQMRRAVGVPMRVASLLADVHMSGQLNLLTSTSFDGADVMGAMHERLPGAVAYLALAAPTANGNWRVRGTLAQGEVRSWVLAGAFERAASATHRFEAGLSYGTQQYVGANPAALAATRDARRNVASVYGYDNWTINPRVAVSYGAKYARYDYLADPGLISPRLGLSVRPFARDSLTLRAAVSHRETAPGAQEFLPAAQGLWLPPERTFSSLGDSGFLPERVDHVEVQAERQISRDVTVRARAFREHVEDQVLTVFGQGPARSAGHYYVGSAGDVDATGWGVGVSRVIADGIRAGVDYTEVQARWLRRSLEGETLAQLDESFRAADQRIRDITASVTTAVAATSTRLLFVYKLNTAFAESTSPHARFDMQVNQPLPFLRAAGGDWEMLVAIRSMFHEDAVDGAAYDELLVVKPPRRVLGGVTVRF